METKQNETILIMDFGGQYSQLIARRIRECGVFCEIVPYNKPVDQIKALGPKGIVFSGGPSSVHSENAPKCDVRIFELGIPVLGICYGMQLTALALGGEVAHAKSREYGNTKLFVDRNEGIFAEIGRETQVLMSHGDHIHTPPAGFAVTAHTAGAPVAAMANEQRRIYGVQFHPEVVHTTEGMKMLRNFLFNVCGCSGDWNMGSFVDQAVQAIREQVGDKRVLCALSGGIDSSVAAVLVHRAIGDQLTCVFVNHGFLRKGEPEQVVRTFRDGFKMNLVYADVVDRFMDRMAGVTDPEEKRKIIGNEFIRVFEAEASKLGEIDFLVQGTLYPDVVESGTATAAVIKSHHNVGGLPEDMKFKLVEPLRDLFKDEVRALARELNMPEDIVWRQPFPGPGLAIRIIGEVTAERLEILRDADAIVHQEIKNADLYRKVWQSFAILPAMKSVGVMGDERTYAYTVGLRVVSSEDGMTADWVRLPYEVIDAISRRIVNEVKDVNRVVYDVTSKPPSTIEWE
ncbi:glutamine-hydrolyzing GMP synthase|uniref:GMP synthase [glutamine-hydrolyzing] n=1 Tax=Dendrosporobacter quercicolus TaxID=146817 RepID=A0A1G9P4M6_9FIRM|nr:glutamine-hydrolyzing GMP synthase [Dendrosporobacter quercicolus]NSL47544.1 glutamine-hydrolyzing GMP synthase [Dendrosporobacter quercicolus DSM 1736]SDL93768.1 GMP synthase (glutamine-hydrolyzing) [Dendrosporobacter quercicolus]